MTRFINTKAIIINTYPIKETDRIITFISETGAKSNALAKGIRRINSSFSGKLELFNHVRLFLVRGRNLDIITQVEPINSHKDFYDNLIKLICGMQILNFLNKLLEYKEYDESIYYLLRNTLNALAKSTQPEVIVKIAELKLIAILGYKPQIDKCVNCQGKSSSFLDFSASLGGVVCDKCRTKSLNLIKLDEVTLRCLHFILESSFKALGRVKVPELVLKQLDAIVEQQLREHFSLDLERDLVINLTK